MASIGQKLELLTGANGDAVGSGQWFGGKGFIFVSANSGFNVKIDISPDNGTNWFQVHDVTRGNVAVFSSPALMVRARGAGPSNAQGLNVSIVGYDEA